MKNLLRNTIVLLAAVTWGGVAAANDNLWFGVKAGTLGFGGEVSWRPIEWLDLRAGANFYDYDESGSEAGINYDGTLSLDTYYLTGNVRFPLSPFRLTAGIYANNNEVLLVSQDMPLYELGDAMIPWLPTEVGRLQSVTAFDSTAPYLGAGFDFDIFDRIGLSLDFGVLWQGEPMVTLTADGSAVGDPVFDAALEQERQQLENEMQNLKAYPVISIGFNFNFF